ncbi:MAG: S-adenosylmethionine:tRNA ribosyltransferase-isomerase [Elusimicrobia bacterium]|nr:S-adenosylmethionine:tRNA ribosyltransferase-isomerase [Elusimicrobiota bacterium]
MKSLGFPEIPADRIAQTPLAERDQAKLMVLNRKDGTLAHQRFYHLPDYLFPGDALVLNDVRVLPARLYGKKPTGGRVTVLLLARFPGEGPDRWTALVTPRPRVGSDIFFPDNLQAKVVGDCADGEWELVFSEPVDPVLSRWGRMPLPPYIKRTPDANAEDLAAYQTVYSVDKITIPSENKQKNFVLPLREGRVRDFVKGEEHRPVPQGAVAAPTAGLHFTPELLETIKRKGVRVSFLTLWVGWGTFRPIATDDFRAHRMLPEPYRIPLKTVEDVSAARQEGKKVWAVGTTAVRALESAADRDGAIKAGTGIATLYITPGYPFRAIDHLVTNFHMPGHTPLVLTAAFAGIDPLRHAYEEAIAKSYRFLSYGDAMAIL